MAKKASSSNSKHAMHWQKTKSLTLWTLIIWVLLSFVVHNFAPGIGAGFSYFMAGMGSQVGFAILVAWFAMRQGKIDDDHGVSG